MLDDREILNILSQELGNATGGSHNDSVENDRKDALAYYLGNVAAPVAEGRSSVVSTDVADAIEWLLPEIMESLTRSDEVVTFDPTGEDDVDQAALESAYTYEYLMKHNSGYVVLHESVKDALMQKNGVVKTFYEEVEARTTERYTGIDQNAYDFIVGRDDVELAEESSYVDEAAYGAMQDRYLEAMGQWQHAAMNAQPGQPAPPPPPEPPVPMLYDVKVIITATEKRITVISVPPEEFRINRMHNNIDPTKARFCAHVTLKSKSELIAEGYSKDIVDALPKGHSSDDDRDYRFYMQNESVFHRGDETADDSATLVEVAECYLHIDSDEDGIAEFRKITTAGGDEASVILDNEEMDIDDHPFSTGTAILMSHKWNGMSIYDRLRQIQDHKTAVLRSIQDNQYLQNNQRTIVGPGVNLDDMMVSRPGGLVRASNVANVVPIVTPPIGAGAYQLLDYLDQMRAGRTGVSPDAQMQTDSIGSAVGSQGVERLMSAKEKLVQHMVRVIAETLVKPMMYLIRDQLRKNLNSLVDFEHRGQWRQVDPSQWKAKRTTTVRVGVGSGNTMEQRSTLNQMGAMMEKIQAMPGQVIVDEKNVYNLGSTVLKLSGVQNTEAYLTDPESPEGQKRKQAMEQQQKASKEEADKKEQMQYGIQKQIADAEMAKSQVAAQNQQLKNQIEELKLQVKNAENQAGAATDDSKTSIEWAKLEWEKEKAALADAMKLTELEISNEQNANAAYIQSEGTV